MLSLIAILMVLVTLGLGAKQPTSTECTLLDMSYSYSNDTLVWPNARKFEIQNRTAKINEKGRWEANENFCSPEHGGTHLDAPFHFASWGWTVDQIPVQRLLATAAVINIVDEAAANADAEVTVKHLTEWERINGRLPNDAVVILNSGWGRRWENASAYFGNGDGDISKFHFPGFHQDAAQWLIDKRAIVGVGVDTPSVDFGATHDFIVHTLFSQHNIYILENVAKVEQLPIVGAQLIIMPMKIRSGTGAPCRIVAQICTATSGSSAMRLEVTSLVALLVFLYLFLA